MRFVLVSGSHRNRSNSAKVAHHCAAEIQKLFPNAEPHIVDLTHAGLPFWEESFWDSAHPNWIPISDKLKSADALVIVTPEWGGMVPSGLKNFFLLANSSELGHKPALIVSVSAGMGGAYPIAELRASSYKNNRLCYIPEHVIVRYADHVLNAEPAQGEHAQSDAYLRKRIGYALKILEAYARALREVRPLADHKAFPNGM